jgi:protein tyrosine/serine phosphatase
VIIKNSDLQYFIKPLKYILFLLLFIVVAAFIIINILGNHYTVATDVYRSGQLNKYNLEYYIKKDKLKTIINLRGKFDGDDYRNEVKLSKKYNIKLIDYSMWNSEFLDFDKISEIVEILKNAKKPLLIHCYGGADRTSLVSALYLFSVEKKSQNIARKEFSILYGHTPYFRKKVIAMDNSFDNYIKIQGAKNE